MLVCPVFLFDNHSDAIRQALLSDSANAFSESGLDCCSKDIIFDLGINFFRKVQTQNRFLLTFDYGPNQRKS